MAAVYFTSFRNSPFLFSYSLCRHNVEESATSHASKAKLERDSDVEPDFDVHWEPVPQPNAYRGDSCTCISFAVLVSAFVNDKPDFATQTAPDSTYLCSQRDVGEWTMRAQIILASIALDREISTREESQIQRCSVLPRPRVLIARFGFQYAFV